MLSERVKKSLTEILGKEFVSFAKEDLLCYSYDATNKIILPDGVAFPVSTDEVSRIMKLASAEGFPVVPRGAGSGFTGGSVPIDGGLVLSTERMNRIISIDTENLIAVVEPGVVTWELQQEVESVGLFYPPDPSSLKFSTIGGNIAECAGGPRAVKYGVTRDYVLGLTVVMPNGDVIDTGVVTAKGVVGYDMTRLIVGSEGTLGIVTQATLRLIPLPEATRTLLAIFTEMNDAANTVAAIVKARIVPSTLELVDSACMRAVEEYAHAGLPATGAILIIETDGWRESVERESGMIAKICRDNNAASVEEASDKKKVKDPWKARRAISASLYRIKPNKINEDIVVPRSKVPLFMAGVQSIAAKRGLLIACFGHAGDGNIHVNIMYDKTDKRENAGAEEAVTEVFGLALSLKGTISGEHGIGTSKAPYLAMELKKEAINAMSAVKAAFDPKGILNPGKIFTRSK